MTRLLISLTLRAYYSLTSPIEQEPVESLVCKVGGCCDCETVSSSGMNMCMGCSGANSASECATGEDFVDCKGACFVYTGKFTYVPGGTALPSACK